MPNDNDDANEQNARVCGTPKRKCDDDEIVKIVITPKKTRRFNKENLDGIVLTRNEDHEFLEPTNISPILKNQNQAAGNVANTAGSSTAQTVDGLQNIVEEEEDHELDMVNDTIDTEITMNKRKRDSFDNISLISTDSFAPAFNSAKKPKLIRTGSITRTLRRSMSFVALKNPISNMIRARRNSVDPNTSISSMTSIESTFNESIKKPVKDKLRNIKERIMKTSNGNKREFCLTPKTSKTLRKICEANGDKYAAADDVNDNVDASIITGDMQFKTPLAPTRPSGCYHATAGNGLQQRFAQACEAMDDSIALECPSMAEPAPVPSTVTPNKLGPSDGILHEPKATFAANGPAQTGTTIRSPDHPNSIVDPLAEQHLVLISLIFFS